MVTVSEFIDSIPHLSAGKKATLKTHVQSREFGASLDADCDEVFQEVLQETLPATFNLLERATLKRALKQPVSQQQVHSSAWQQQSDIDAVDAETDETPVRSLKVPRNHQGKLFLDGIKEALANRGLVLLGIGEDGFPAHKDGWTIKPFNTSPVQLIVGPKPGPIDAWRDEYRRDMANLKALINRPSVISTTTLQELGGQANKKPKVEVPLPQPNTLAWESPVWAHVTSFNNQLLEADKGLQKGLQSLFGDLLPTAPISTPFVFHDVHTRPSVCGDDLKPDVVMGLRDKPCIPLTTAAIIDFKRQDGGYDNDENVGKAITYGRVFLQQLPRTLRKMVLVGLTDFLSITLVLVRMDSNAQGAEDLSFEMSARLPDVKRTFLQLLSCEPQRWFVELPDLGPSVEIVGLLGAGATSHVYEAAEGGQQVVAKVPFIQDLSRECAILQSLQGIAGVPELLHNQCVGDSILMRPVLDPLTAGAFFVHSLHNSLPSLVQTLKAAHCKPIINRDIRPSNLMHAQSTIYLVDWGSATLLQRSLYEGTVHYASLGVLQQLTQDLSIIETGPADDLESLVASVFCISHTDAHQELQRCAKLPALVMQWWIQTWNSRPQWQLALTAARAANHGAVADCLQALLE